MRLCVLHNLYFYNTMMTEIRDAIDGASTRLQEAEAGRHDERQYKISIKSGQST